MAGRPGTEYIRAAAVAQSAIQTDTGRGFTVGIADEGPIAPTLLTSFGDFLTGYVGDTPTAAAEVLRTNVQTFFQEGGTELYLQRVFGPSGDADDDDRDNIADAQWDEAMDLLIPDYGPGQVFADGTTSTRHGQLLSHAASHNRVALLDLASGLAAGAAATAAATTSALSDAEYGAIFGNWMVAPQRVAGTDRTVAPSAVVAGLIARSDASRDAGSWPIGDEGRPRYARSAVTTYTDAERTTLTAAGVNVFIDNAAGLRLYGFRSANVDVPDLRNFGHQRLLMAIEAEALRIGEAYVGRRITNSTIRSFHGQIEGYLASLEDSGAFYTGPIGDEPGFAVVTASPVNTPDTAADGELNADVQVRFAENAEVVRIRSITVPVTQSVAA